MKRAVQQKKRDRIGILGVLGRARAQLGQDFQSYGIFFRADTLVPMLAILNAVLLGGACMYVFARTVDIAPRIAPGASMADDEITSDAKKERDYQHWLEQFEALQREGRVQSVDVLDPIEEEQTWEARPFIIPDVQAARATLRRKLSEGVVIEDIYPVGAESLGFRHSRAVYQVRLRFETDFVLLPIKRMRLATRQYGDYSAMSFLVASRDLDPGYFYSVEKARRVVQAEQEILLNWRVRDARIVGGDWRILDSDPVLFGPNADFEARHFEERRQRLAIGRTTIDEAGPILVLRSAAKADQLGNEGTRALIAFNKRINAITEAVTKYQREVWSEVDGEPAWKPTRFGGAADGEPSTSAVSIPMPQSPRARLVEVPGRRNIFGFVEGSRREWVEPSDEEHERYRRQLAHREKRIEAVKEQRKAAAALVAKFDQFLKEELTQEMMMLAKQRRDRIRGVLLEPTRFVTVRPTISPRTRQGGDELEAAVARMNGQAPASVQTATVTQRGRAPSSPFSSSQTINEAARAATSSDEAWAPPLPGSQEARAIKERWVRENAEKLRAEEKQRAAARKAQSAKLEHEGVADDEGEASPEVEVDTAQSDPPRSIRDVIRERQQRESVSNSRSTTNDWPMDDRFRRTPGPQRYVPGETPSNVYRPPRVYTDP